MRSKLIKCEKNESRRKMTIKWPNCFSKERNSEFLSEMYLKDELAKLLPYYRD